MSRRAIKRVEQLQQASLTDSDEDRQSIAATAEPSFDGAKNLFALLEDGGSDGDASDDRLENHYHDSDSHKSPPVPERNVNSDGNSSDGAQHDNKNIEESFNEMNNRNVSKQSKKNKKKKRRKAQKRSEPSEAPEDDPDWIALNEAQAENASKSENGRTGFIPSTYFSVDDDIEVREEARRIMTLIERMAFSNEVSGQSAGFSDSSSLNPLIVEPKLLNADTELKRLFGAHIVGAERRTAEGSVTQGGRRKRGGGQQGRIRRRISLVSPRETWADHAPGLIMDLDSEATNRAEEAGLLNVKYFFYKHEGSYARIQDEYREVVKTNDPDNLVHFCAHHPYHVDSLLQIAELHRQMGELDRAAEQIERCIYILEEPWPVTFKPFDGKCRLSFDVLENRSLYIALFRYSQLLSRRGLHRTSFEIGKLLLNFDPENDPLGILMLADSYALLSGEYGWIEDMRMSYNYLPIEYFPNFMASAALAIDAIRMSGLADRYDKSSKTKSVKGEGSDALDEAVEAKRAEAFLVDVLLTFPMLLRPLLNAIDCQTAVWSEYRLFEEPWYSAGYEDGGLLRRISLVYAEWSKMLWNSGRNKELLIHCARRAGKLDSDAGMGKDSTTGRLTSAFVSDEQVHERVAHCRALRVEAANWLSSSGLYRNLQFADLADSTANLPADIFAHEQIAQPVEVVPPRDVSIRRGTVEFFQSLLPWREPRDARPAEN